MTLAAALAAALSCSTATEQQLGKLEYKFTLNATTLFYPYSHPKFIIAYLAARQ